MLYDILIYKLHTSTHKAVLTVMYAKVSMEVMINVLSMYQEHFDVIVTPIDIGEKMKKYFDEYFDEY